MTTSISLPVLSSDAGLSQYLREINQFAFLKEEEEHALAERWQKNGDIEAAHQLVTSHLKLVAKIATGFRGYGLPLMELIAEGNIGLMQAVKRFDPDKGFRLSTYAMWWIKASIQEYILRSWSLVKIGTTSAQKKLFFNLRKIKNRISAIHDHNNLLPEEVNTIASELNVSETEVVEMNARMYGGDHSLNEHIGNDAEDGNSEWIDYIEESGDDQETLLLDNQEHKHKQLLLTDAMAQLNERERYIITERRLKEHPATLEELSQHYGISRERVRQIEVRAIEKMQQTVEETA